jgi:hypothetical protein
MSLRNPTAGIVVYNYLDRGGSKAISSQNYERIVLTKSIVSIRTNKSKSSPSGRFEIILAPTKNWIAALSTGSWLEIHMSPYQMTEKDLESSNKSTLKMIGVIDSVRMSMSVDQTTGARSMHYVLVGRDWGSIFESYLYIDSTVESYADSPLLNAIKLTYQVMRGSDVDNSSMVKTTTDLVKTIVKSWGMGVALGIYKNGQLDNTANSASYVLPSQLSSKLTAPGLSVSLPSVGSSVIAQYVDVVDGVLSGHNQYAKDIKEAKGPFNAEALRGINSMWQLLNTHANTAINELVTDLRWENNNSRPTLTLYKRVKPFWLKKNKRYLSSSFFLLKKCNIDKNDVVSVEVGTNSQDVINYVEVVPDFTLFTFKPGETIGAQAYAKGKGPQYDAKSFARHGFKPLMYSTRFVPVNQNGNTDWQFLIEWGKMLADWYFDTHKMLNGTISIMGQNDFIGVGDNITVDASLFGHTSYVKGNSKGKFIAHVESVSHSFSYIENGSRSFLTNISFTRGIMANEDATALVSDSSFAVESDVKALPADKTLIDDVYGE